MSWYVLFVKTGYEKKVANEIAAQWRVENLHPFVPMYDARFRKAGKVLSEKRRLFPGYVFVESDLAGTDFHFATRSLIYQSEHVLKLLRNGKAYEDDSSFEMKEHEQQILQELCDKDYCINISQGIIVGDMVSITHGPLIGYESRIKRINRHKMEAVVTVNIMGDSRDIAVGLEIVQKI